MERKNFLIILLIMALGFIFMNQVRAQEFTFNVGSYMYGTYVKKVMPNGSTRFETARFLKRSDGMFVYCIEPFEEFNSSSTKISYNNGNTNILSADVFEIINLLAYYGYKYQNHTEDKWYIITQVMIWKTVDRISSIYFTKTLNGEKTNIYDSEMQELENLVTKHNQLNIPLNHNINLNETLKLTNENLKGFKIISGNASLNDNELIVKGNKVGNNEIILEKKDTRFSSPPILYVDSEGQNLFIGGYYNPIKVTLNINVLGGKIKLIKKDSETTTQQGEATLNGARYEIKNEEGKVVSNLTITNGSAVSDYLPYGNYTIKETKASLGYNIDDKEYNVTLKSNYQELTVLEDVIKGKIELLKIDSETKKCNADLKNAVYGIYDLNNNLVEKLFIDDNCKATSKSLPYGTYNLKEIESPRSYNIDTNNYQIKIESNKNIKIISEEEKIKGKIKIKKVDSETITQQGEATLVGAIYGIYDLNNNLIETLTINDSNESISNYLNYGNYYLKEIKASKGYYLNEEKINFSITSNETIEKEVLENVIKNKIELYKFYGFEETGFLYSEPNALFEIKGNNDVYTLTTNQEGKLELTLPYGTYTITQLSGIETAKMMYPFKIEVNENTDLIQKINLKNGLISSKVQVTKIDSETKMLIKDKATFKIKDLSTDEYVCQITDKIICEYDTKDGVMITPLELKGGKYALIEVDPPIGYEIGEELIFEIKSDNIKNGNLGSYVDLIYENKVKKGALKIVKTQEIFDKEYSLIKPSNIKFDCYAKEDIVVNNMVYYKKDELINTLIVNNGTSLLKDLYIGKYYLKEINDSKYEQVLVDFEINLNNLEIVKNITNYLKKGTIVIYKKDKSTLENIDATFEIYDEFKNLIKTEKTSNGVLNIELPYGIYYILEVEAENDYLLNSEIYKINLNEKIVNKTIYNEKKTGLLKIKKHSKNKLLEGVVFGIYSNDSLISEVKTDEFGEINLSLKVGNYYLKELKTLDDYILDGTLRPFTINSDNVVEFNLENESKQIYEIKIPDTLSNRSYLLELISLILIFIYEKKKIIKYFIILLILINSEKIVIKDIRKNKIEEMIFENKINYLEIPKISLKEIVDKNNNLENIELLDVSKVPSSTIIVGHSGTGLNAYFNNLYKLKKDDLIYFNYDNIKYTYKVIDTYLIDKTGFVNLPNLDNYIMLITCYKKNKQLVVIGQLLNIS